MNILKSALLGLILIVASSILLFWAEGRAVKTARALEEGSGIVIEVTADRIDAANDGRLVHISGAIAPQDVPTDRKTGITAEGAVTLLRKVEMLQWKETSREVERTGSDGSKTKTTVYDYEKVWSDTAIDSSKFKTASAPRNPPMPLTGDRFPIAEAKLGAFRLSGNDVAALGEVSPVMLKDTGITGAANAIGGAKPVWLVNNQYLSADDPDKPQIGDVRIGYERRDLDRASAVGKQAGERLVPYAASNGREIFLIQSGTATAAEMFKDAIEGNIALTWVLRVLGLILMFVGFAMSFSPLTATLGKVPVIGGIVRGGASLVGLVMTLMLGSIVIAAGWIFYRPLLALGIVAVGMALAFALGLIGKKKEPAAAQA